MIEDKFDYDRKRGLEQALEDLDKPVGANAGDSRMVLEYLEEVRQQNKTYDILLINCGLHDIRVDRVSNKKQIGLEEYKKNLTKIIELSTVMADRTMWIGITPVIDDVHNAREVGFLRYNRNVCTYDIDFTF